MSVISLKPCPFCGGEAVATYDSEYNPKGVYWVSCGRCGAMPRGVFNTEAEAIQAWNTRVNDMTDEQRSHLTRLAEEMVDVLTLSGGGI